MRFKVQIKCKIYVSRENMYSVITNKYNFADASLNAGFSLHEMFLTSEFLIQGKHLFLKEQY